MKERMILFVCTGNICRSPMAECMLANDPASAGWVIGSAGLAAPDGLPASREAIRVLRQDNLDLTSHRSRSITRELVDAATIIVVMTTAHRDALTRLYPDVKEKVFLLGTFGAGQRKALDIEDPMGGSEEVYRITRDLIAKRLKGLKDFIKEMEMP